MHIVKIYWRFCADLVLVSCRTNAFSSTPWKVIKTVAVLLAEPDVNFNHLATSNSFQLNQKKTLNTQVKSPSNQKPCVTKICHLLRFKMHSWICARADRPRGKANTNAILMASSKI